MASQNRLKVGAVSFLNTKPLIHTLDQFDEIDLTLDFPSRLADQLKSGELDVALIPIIEYFRNDNYRIIPEIAIASRGEVLSILLFSDLPINECETIALDTSSRTSQALLKILLKEKFQISQPNVYRYIWITCEPSINPKKSKADAVLLIGDSAIRQDRSTKFVTDLGKEWTNHFDLPFVYACWVAREGIDLGELPNILKIAKKRGIESIAEIAKNASIELGFPKSLCEKYLTRHIFFDLGSREIAGLTKFYELAVRHGLAESGKKIRFVK